VPHENANDTSPPARPDSDENDQNPAKFTADEPTYPHPRGSTAPRQEARRQRRRRSLARTANVAAASARPENVLASLSAQEIADAIRRQPIRAAKDTANRRVAEFSIPLLYPLAVAQRTRSDVQVALFLADHDLRRADASNAYIPDAIVVVEEEGADPVRIVVEVDLGGERALQFATKIETTLALQRAGRAVWGLKFPK